MPIKRRASKRRIDPAAEIEIFASVFESGFDLFSDASDHLGLTEPVHIRWDDQRENGERLWREAIGSAWHRLGSHFIAQRGWVGEGGHPLWALERFGEPSHAR